MLHRAVALSTRDHGGLQEAIALLESAARRLERSGEHGRPDLAAARTTLSSHLLAISAVRDARGGDESVVRLVRAGADAALGLLAGSRIPVAIC